MISFSKKLSKLLPHTLQSRLIITFTVTSAFILLVNLYLFININTAIRRIERIYSSNIEISTLSDQLSSIQSNLTGYLSTKSSDVLGEYYASESAYQNTLDSLAPGGRSEKVAIELDNIKGLSQSYLKVCDDALSAKRGRNIQLYKKKYSECQQLYDYLQTYIYSLNDSLLHDNSDSYIALRNTFRSLELTTFLVLISVTLANLMIVLATTSAVTHSIRDLVRAADDIGQGNFDIDPLPANSYDEIGVVSNAFNKMVVSIREYLDKLRESMELENSMRQKELKMDAHLKEAELKYLQAQINPHFLFNTLNAGVQLSMMEGADRTYKYLQNVSAFFRAKTNRESQVTTLADEIDLVDSFIYIINVRFSGTIGYEKEIDEDLVGIQMPSMILQPIIENAINHGVRDIDWPAKISLMVYKAGPNVAISIKDNGRGMTLERIEEVLEGKVRVREKGDETNGVGLANVVNRLRLFYDTDDVFDITSAGLNKGTEVIMYLPLSSTSEASNTGN